MKNPYEVLGVTPFSSEAEIKKAYKRAVSKYYSSTDRESIAKMEELNQAYDELIMQKRGQNPSSKQSAAVSEFADVRRLIKDARLSDAEELLDSVRSLSRGGEWNYLKALVLFKKGLMREASAYIERALEKDSLSSEFRELYSKLNDTVNTEDFAGKISGLLRKFLGSNKD